MGQIFELRIEDMSSEGQGIGRISEAEENEKLAGLVVFVPNTVPCDVAKAELTKVKKRYAFSKLVKIIKESPLRNKEALCPYGDSCGGCPYIGINYEAQLEIKEKQVREKLAHMAETDVAKLRPIVGAQANFRYRNKAVMPISTGGLITKKGGIVEPVHEPRIGFRPRKSHKVINCRDCILQAETAMAAAESTRRFMLEDNITSFDTRWDKGLMKSMCVKTAFGSGEVMVIYEINGKGIPNAAKLIQYLDEAVYEAGGNLESVVIKNDKKTQVLAGKDTITDVIEIEGRSINVEISPDSFYQVNPDQMQRLYSVARDYCKRITESMTDKPVIWDIYCGIGTVGMCVADMAEHVHGIEIVKDAVIDANRNATINGIVNATYECGRAEKLIVDYVNNGQEDNDRTVDGHNRLNGIEGIGGVADIAILDPPRAGCKPELLEAIAKAEVPNIIYISCDPATLARDIKILRGYGYLFEEGTPVDMFPHTLHVETVVLLRREKVDGYVDIDLDVENLVGNGGTATYAEIKAFVEEKHGMKVSRLYIGQIKNKVGMEKRKNYNTGSGEGRVPVCPPEKEEAIMDAFRHFNLIKGIEY